MNSIDLEKTRDGRETGQKCGKTNINRLKKWSIKLRIKVPQ